MAAAWLTRPIDCRTDCSWALSIAVTAAIVTTALIGCDKPGATAPPPSQTQSVTPSTDAATQAIEIGGRTFDLELALNDSSRYMGLSDRKEIAADGGMLFVFPSPRRAEFVMRRCYVPIDLIYIDNAGYIDSMHRMQVVEPVGGDEWEQPSSGYPSVGRVQFVIELKGGTLDQLGIQPGQKIDLPKQQLILRAQ